jgi:hypothetical protein
MSAQTPMRCFPLRHSDHGQGRIRAGLVGRGPAQRSATWYCGWRGRTGPGDIAGIRRTIDSLMR